MSHVYTSIYLVVPSVAHYFMRILHLLSQRELTGAEVYALDLAQAHVRSGHQCIIASDRLNVACELPFYRIPLGNRRFLTRLANIRRVMRLIDEQKIDVVHAHSRASSWVAFFATRLCRVAYVSTIHGRQSLHFTSEQFNVYGQRVIAVCPHLVDHLVQELHLPRDRVYHIPNGIQC